MNEITYKVKLDHVGKKGNAFTRSPVTVTCMASGATFSSFCGAMLFFGVTRTRYPFSLAAGGLQSTTKDEGLTSPNWMLVGAGTAAKSRANRKNCYIVTISKSKPVTIIEIKELINLQLY